MSFRSIEMQIAIPRTSEVGHVQNQLMQKPVYDQAALAEKMLQQKERQLQQTEKAEEPPSAFIRDESQQSNGKEQKRQKAKRAAADANGASSSARSEHPYKGKHIDFSL